MSRIRPEYLDRETSDRSVADDVLVREEPDEEDNDEEGDGEKKKRAKKKTTRATQSDHRMSPVVRLRLALREHRHNKSRQAQILERGASRSAAVIRHNDQFKCGDIREFNLVFLDFAYRVRWAEIPLLAHDFSKRASAVRRPPQDELLGALYRGFFEDERDACESLRLIED